MRKIQRLSVAAMAVCLAVPFSAPAQENGECKPADCVTTTIDTFRKKIPDETLRIMAKLVFKGDIKARRLSEERAFSYYKCASERYQNTIDDDTIMLMACSGHGADTKPSLAEITRISARLAQAAEKVGKVQIEAENACKKSLGISGVSGKVFPLAGRPFLDFPK
ncbi:MAG: hypothetical protein LBR95_03270 [Azoarcus sp.]|jgi:hypothetical protein|nr:hypothetical protein [Azoarcus sp.]